MKKVKTIFVSALLALSVSFSVVACNNGEETKATTDSVAPAPAPATDSTAPAATDSTTATDSSAATKPVKTPTN